MDGDLSRKSSLTFLPARHWTRGPTMFQGRPLLPARREIKLLRGQIILSSRSATNQSGVRNTITIHCRSHSCFSFEPHWAFRFPLYPESNREARRRDDSGNFGANPVPSRSLSYRIMCTLAPCRSTVDRPIDRLSADYRPTIDRLSTDSRSMCQPTVGL